jgi:hypothetical protein
MRRISKKRYLGKATYTYTQCLLAIPKRFHSLINPEFISAELDIRVEKMRNKLVITLVKKPRKA